MKKEGDLTENKRGYFKSLWIGLFNKSFKSNTWVEDKLHSYDFIRLDDIEW